MSNPLTDEVVARSQLTDDFLFRVVDDPTGAPTERTVSITDAISAGNIAVADVAGNFDAADVEAVLAEVKVIADAAVPLTPNATIGTGAAVYRTAKTWYGDLFTIGNGPGSIGFAGTPTSAPATTVGVGGVTFPLTNGTVPIADCAQLSATGGSFTVGGVIVAYKGRSAASGAGNATGCWTLSTATGTYPSGTALSYTSIGHGALAVYHEYGDKAGGSNAPVPGTTQGYFGITNYWGPTVTDSMEGFSHFVGVKNTSTAFTQALPVTAGEFIAQVEGANTLTPAAPMLGVGARINVTDTATADTAIFFKTSFNSTGTPSANIPAHMYGFYQPAAFGSADSLAVKVVDGITTQTKVAVGNSTDTTFQATIAGTADSTNSIAKVAAPAIAALTTLNGAVSLPIAAGTITLTSAAALPSSGSIQLPNSSLSVRTVVTYTGKSGNDLTGCSSAGLGSGTIASGTAVLPGAAVNGAVLRLNAQLYQSQPIFEAYSGDGSQRVRIDRNGNMTLAGTSYFAATGANVTTCSMAGNSGAITPGTSTGPGAAIYSGSGAPNITGSVTGSIYFRTDGGVGTTIYRATGTNTWGAIL